MEPGRIHRIIEEGIQREASADLSWTGGFGDYLGIVAENPRVCRNAFQRLLDMVLSYGTVEYASHGEKITHCNFFDDPLNDSRDAILGLDRQAVPILGHLRAAAAGLGAERRLLLLQGPPGSGKSAILRLLKRGLEEYSATAQGALYTFRWVIPRFVILW